MDLQLGPHSEHRSPLCDGARTSLAALSNTHTSETSPVILYAAQVLFFLLSKGVFVSPFRFPLTPQTLPFVLGRTSTDLTPHFLLTSRVRQNQFRLRSRLDKARSIPFEQLDAAGRSWHKSSCLHRRKPTIILPLHLPLQTQLQRLLAIVSCPNHVSLTYPKAGAAQAQPRRNLPSL